MSKTPFSDHNFMQEAYQLASLFIGFTAPNPPVGAVIVKNHHIIGRGAHQRAGSPHAEIHALNSCDNAKGATAYVTLEPCCHFGKTPPCTSALIQAGISRVVYAYRDPNPSVNSKGIRALEAAGITCHYLPLPEVNNLYQSYHYHNKYQQPYVHCKLAISQNGYISGPNGVPASITGERAKHFTHLKRQSCHAILTSIRTVINDDPQLNVRLHPSVQSKPIYVLDSQLRCPINARITKTAESLTLFHQENICKKKKNQLENMGIQCVTIPSQPEGLHLQTALDHIGSKGHYDLWIEAGAKVCASFLREQRIHQLLLLIAPIELPQTSITLTHYPPSRPNHWQMTQTESLGLDTLFVFEKNRMPHGIKTSDPGVK